MSNPFILLDLVRRYKTGNLHVNFWLKTSTTNLNLWRPRYVFFIILDLLFMSRTNEELPNIRLEFYEILLGFITCNNNYT